MRLAPCFPALILALAGTVAGAQGYDPVQKATGWSRVDRDGSCTFFDAGTKTLQTWTKDGGITGSLDLSRAGLTPEHWVLDSQGNAWLVSRATLLQVDKKGKPGKAEALPAEVGDVSWDAKGFVLCYRTREPYLEKRDYKHGQVIWSYGAKPQKGDAVDKVLHRVTVNEDGHVILASGPSMALWIIDAAKGKSLGQTVFTFQEARTPDLALGEGERPPFAWWLGHSMGFMGIPGSMVPAAKMAGLLLARLDIPKGTLDFLPTGLTEDHVFLGVTETEAILQAPKGGLVFVPLP